jgi:hypothetical protein
MLSMMDAEEDVMRVGLLMSGISEWAKLRFKNLKSY